MPETRQAIRHRHVSDVPALAPGEWPDRAPDLVLRSEMPPGAIVGIDEDDLVRVAVEQGVVIEIVPHVGDYLPSLVPLARVWADDGTTPTTTAADAARSPSGTPWTPAGSPRTTPTVCSP